MKNVQGSYIVSSLSKSKAEEYIETMIMQALCQRGGSTPCGVCRSCKKVKGKVHPDVYYVRKEDNKTSKTGDVISVNQIRDMVEDSVMLPNEGEKKVYVVCDAEKMRHDAQDAALKLLEEPPSYAVLILDTRDITSLLPTIRSRCREIVLNENSDQADEALNQAVESFMTAVAKSSQSELWAWSYKNDKMDIKTARAFMSHLHDTAVKMLTGEKSDKGIKKETLLNICSLAKRCSHALRVNTSVKALISLLAVKAI